MRRSFRFVPLVLLLVLWSATAPARETVFLSPSPIDLTRLLPPPPALGSPAQQHDLDVLLRLQQTRTPAQTALAQADGDRSVFRFADVLGEAFTEQNVPLTAALFEDVQKTANHIVGPAKKHWDRPRPYVTDPAIEPVLPKPASASYPSAHSTFGNLAAILLANMVPEKQVALYARGELYAHNRELGGVHYPTDVEAGRLSATVIAAFLLNDPAFREEFAKATAETRRVLGLGPYQDSQGKTSSAK